ncbi:MAG: hypothetical protein ABIH86_05865, partial [Planctomycetota bacterium]
MSRQHSKLLIDPDDIPLIRYPRFGRPLFRERGATFEIALKIKPVTAVGPFQFIHPSGLVYTSEWTLLHTKTDSREYPYANAFASAVIPKTLPPALYDIAFDAGDGKGFVISERCLVVYDDEPSTLRIAHISDINLNSPSVEMLAPELIDEINIFNPDITFVTGDLTEWDASLGWTDFPYALSYLKQLRSPVLIEIGDHESIDFFKSEIGAIQYKCEFGAFHFIAAGISDPELYADDEMARAWLIFAIGEIESSNGIGAILAHDPSNALYEFPGESALLGAGVRLIVCSGQYDIHPILDAVLRPESSEIDVVTTAAAFKTDIVNGQPCDRRRAGYRIIQWDGLEFQTDYFPETPPLGPLSPLSQRRRSIPSGYLEVSRRRLAKDAMEITVRNGLKRDIKNARIDVAFPGLVERADCRGGRTPGETQYLPSSKTSLASLMIDVPELGFSRARIAPSGCLPIPKSAIEIHCPEKVCFGAPFNIAVDVEIFKTVSKTALLIVFAQGEFQTISFPAEIGAKRTFNLRWIIHGYSPRTVSVGAYLHHDPIPVFCEPSVSRPARVRSLIRAESGTIHIECQLNKFKFLPDNTRWMLSGYDSATYGLNELINSSFPLPDGDTLTRRVVPVLFGDDWDYPMTRDAIILRAFAVGSQTACDFKLLDDRTGAD